MYIVKCDGQLLYDPRVPGLEMFEAKLAFEDNKKAGFDFTIYPTHPLYNSIKKLKSVIEVYRDGNRLFRGRWVDDERGWHNERKIECDDDLSFLDDSIVRPYDYQGDVKPYLQQLINGHNAQVEEGKRFVLRNVTVTDPNGYITRANINYPNTWSEIEDKLIKILGGHIMLEYVDGVNYLDYLIDSPYKSDQKIELGKNLLDLKETDIAAKVATAVIPLGAKLKDESGNETDQRLTIAAINGGKDYVFSQVAVDAYGWIFRTVSYDDVNEAVNLKRKGEQDLASSIMQSITIELTALDLSHTDKSVDDFKFMAYVEAESDIHGVSGEYLVTKMNLDLLNPTADRLIIGETYQGFTGKQLAQKQKYESESANFAKTEQVKAARQKVISVEEGIEKDKQAMATTIDGIKEDIKTTSEGVDKLAGRVQLDDGFNLITESDSTFRINADGSIRNTPDQPLKLVNGWKSISNQMPASYRINVNGEVSLSGVITGGTITAQTVLFTLPLNYRPSKLIAVYVPISGTIGQLQIKASGECVIVQSDVKTSDYIDLSKINYKVGGTYGN